MKNHHTTICAALLAGLLFSGLRSAEAQQYQFDNTGAAAFGGDFGSGLSNPIFLTGQWSDRTRHFWYPYKAAFRSGRIEDFPEYWEDCSPVYPNPGPLYYWDASEIGDYSIAVGYNVLASGKSSVALGGASLASANWTVALGYDNKSQTEYAVSIGNRNVSDGQHALSLGYLNDAMGTRSVAIGSMNGAHGYGSVSLGYGTNSNNLYTLATGGMTTASGLVAFAGGMGSSAVGDYSVALGHETEAKHTGTVAVGVYNDSLIGEVSDEDADDRPLLIVGNGTSVTPSNAFVVYADGTADIQRVEPRGGIGMGQFTAQ